MTTEAHTLTEHPEDSQPLCPFCLTVQHTDECNYATLRTAIAVRDGEMARMRRALGDVRTLNDRLNNKKAVRTQRAIETRIQRYLNGQ